MNRKDRRKWAKLRKQLQSLPLHLHPKASAITITIRETFDGREIEYDILCLIVNASKDKIEVYDISSGQIKVIDRDSIWFPPKINGIQISDPAFDIEMFQRARALQELIKRHK